MGLTIRNVSKEEDGKGKEKEKSRQPVHNQEMCICFFSIKIKRTQFLERIRKIASTLSLKTRNKGGKWF